MSDINTAQLYHEFQLQKQQREQQRQDKLNAMPEIQVAEIVHSMICRSGHPEACTFDIETWGSPGNSKQYFLKKGTDIVQALKDAGLEVDPKIITQIVLDGIK